MSREALTVIGLTINGKFAAFFSDLEKTKMTARTLRDAGLPAIKLTRKAFEVGHYDDEAEAAAERRAS